MATITKCSLTNICQPNKPQLLLSSPLTLTDSILSRLWFFLLLSQLSLAIFFGLSFALTSFSS